jgi:hypothetical protein
MRWRSPVLLFACAWLVAGAACGPQPDLKAVKLIPGISGYHDDGIVQEGRDKGQNRLLPSVTFQIKNEGTLPVDYLDVTVAFWRVTDDGEKDSKLIQAKVFARRAGTNVTLGELPVDRRVLPAARNDGPRP